MIRGEKIREAYQAAGASAYPQFWRECLGLTRDLGGNLTMDKSKQTVDPMQVSIQEVAYEFLGIRPEQELDKLQSLQLQEIGGGTVLPSTFSSISAFKDTITGLLEALVMDAYLQPEFIGDSMCTVIPTRVSGGRMIGVKNTGAEAGQTSLASDEPYPMVGLAEDWVEIQENERRGCAIAINKLTIMYDRTDQVQDAAYNGGYTIARNRELRIARTVMGIDNTYNRMGSTADTYNSIAGASPNNYVNQADITMENYTDVDEAIQVMESNTDPHSEFEITINPEQSSLLCAPNRKLLFKSVIRTTMIERGARATATDLVSQFPNPLDANYPVVSSRIWYNQAAAAGYSDDTWWMGNFPRAFAYRQLIPFFVAAAPVSAEELRRDISLIYIAQEHGVPLVKEPRFAGQFSPEGTG